ncbi:MAG: cytochrome-c oxidase protein [Rhizobium sp.]|nr:cytochrome-c oxidase protein [Rhizobium sp.]
MNGLQETPRGDYLDSPDILLVIRPGTHNKPEIFLAMHADGAVSAFNGHVDLGTGIRTALAQIVAEELDIAFDKVSIILGTTSVAPDQGPTIASETIQITAIPLRQAAATARQHLLAKAARRLGVEIGELRVEDGVIRRGDWAMAYADLVLGQHERIEIDSDVPVKPVEAYRIVGTSQRRNDIAAKSSGEWTYVHDVRVPGMLHGRVIRPPHAGFDHGELVGNSLISVDESSVADIPGVVGVVVVGDFVGVVATREENAIGAMRRLKVLWREQPDRPDLNDVEQALRDNPAQKTRVLADEGNIELALASASPAMNRTYVWPYQIHGSIGPSCAVADWRDGQLTVWSGTQNPHWMRRDLAFLLDMSEEDIVVERLEAAGCYGRNCADDVTADAALLSRAVGRPVRVQLTREQEHGWEPKGAGQVIDVRGGLDLEGGPVGYDFETRYPSNLAPTLALVLTGKVTANDTMEMGDRTAIPPYAFGNLRVQVHDMPPIARASWFRGVSAMPNSFAHESFIDELAAAAGVDPVEYRLRYLTDTRAIDLVHAVTGKAGWKPRTKWGTAGGEGDLLHGRGFAYALYVHGKFPGTPAAWSAWVADVAVNLKTGEVAVTRITVGQDTGMMINPEGVRHQIHGNVIQSISRTLKEKVDFSRTQVESVEWGGYPIITFPEVPEIDVVMLPRQNEEPRGAGESASVPSAAAIVNAVYDATGIRFRELPLTPDRVLEALDGRKREKNAATKSKVKRWWQLGLGITGLAGIAAGGLAVISPIRPAYPEIPRPDPAAFSSATIERGRLAAAAGACNICHVGSDGTAFAGGRAFETPFGKVYATNISPDVKAGIGAWSYPAFERVMRQGIHRDGSHLYPVHPYTSFINADDADLQALYAFLMAEAPVAAKAPETKLSFPYNVRSMMAGWNTLFLTTTATADPAKSEAWNRGASLVEGLGHCSACHTERNVMGAELTGKAHLMGGFADGWEAPAILGAGKGPVGWTETALYDYLRDGHSTDHGSANGPMAHVVQSLSALPDEDIRAMAAYLSGAVPEDIASQQKQAAITAADQAKTAAAMSEPQGARIFDGACTACHADGTPLASLALNTALHSERPDNVLQAILNGADAPALLAREVKADELEIMSMPSFRQSFSDRQLADLAAYLRARFAPDKAPWAGLRDASARVRTIGQ